MIIPSAPGVVVAVIQKTHPAASVQKVQWFKSQKLILETKTSRIIRISSSSNSKNTPSAPGVVAVVIQKTHPAATVQKVQWFKGK